MVGAVLFSDLQHPHPPQLFKQLAVTPSTMAPTIQAATAWAPVSLTMPGDIMAKHSARATTNETRRNTKRCCHQSHTSQADTSTHG